MMSPVRAGRRSKIGATLGGAFAASLGVLASTACGQPRNADSDKPVATSISAGSTVGEDATTATSAEDSEGADETAAPDKLDIDHPMPGGGCEAIDFLFVIDNSASMATYQVALSEQFPDFVDAIFGVLPEGIDVHVGITTTDFDAGCSASEATVNCQSTATIDEVQAHYQRPDTGFDDGNGTQGRLFDYAGQTYFETTSDADPAALATWFGEAAIASGEDGCSFEMPVAAAGFAAHPANAATNEGFIRDAGALLVVFFLTDEPDKSPESKDVYSQMLTDAKAECGGAECIFVSGLVPACAPEINQKLWQFMTALSDESDIGWGDIEATSDYSAVFGASLADAIAEQCASIAIP